MDESYTATFIVCKLDGSWVQIEREIPSEIDQEYAAKWYLKETEGTGIHSVWLLAID